MTDWSMDLLPFIKLLSKEKPIAQGLVVGHGLQTANWPGKWQTINLDELETLAFTKRYDLAVVVLYDHYYGDNSVASKTEASINHADSPTARPIPASLIHGITRLRDVLARQVLVLTRPESGSTLPALGFSQIEQLAEKLVIWQFNILSYKQVPDWLNSKYWANPENWGKYRW
ncbi:DUF6231 family protein [Alkanindiges sp. WGS2144]|uniref:DUF6231 family protein n=1 Tax=Alkanindiges sp. WGS2144 TaxID=3366808 RepID=UPI003751B34B